MKQIWNDRILETLATNPLFATIPTNRLADLLDVLEARSLVFEPGKYIYDSFCPMSDDYEMPKSDVRIIIPVRGEFEVQTFSFVLNNSQKPDFTDTIRANNSSPIWVRQDFTRQYKIMALQLTEIIFIKRESVEIALSQSYKWFGDNQRDLTAFCFNLAGFAVKRGNDLEDQFEHYKVRGLRSKIAAFLLFNTHKYKTEKFTLKLTREDVAKYLGVSRTSLSRELSQMRDDGYLDFYLNTYEIKDIPGLKKLLNTKSRS